MCVSEFIILFPSILEGPRLASMCRPYSPSGISLSKLYCQVQHLLSFVPNVVLPEKDYVSNIVSVSYTLSNDTFLIELILICRRLSTLCVQGWVWVWNPKMCVRT